MGTEQDLFGAWALSDATARRSGADEPAARAIWRVELPDEHEAAMDTLDIQAILLYLDREGILESTERLYYFVDAWVYNQPTKAQELIETIGSPESLLAEALDGLRAGQARSMARDIPDIVEEFQGFLGRVRAFLSNYAVVETAADGRLIARTLVSWTGDFATWSRKDITDDQAIQHHYNTRVAIQRRSLLIQSLSVVLASGADIAMRLGTPGGLLFALPAIWRFIRTVSDEYRRMQAQNLGQ